MRGRGRRLMRSRTSRRRSVSTSFKVTFAHDEGNDESKYNQCNRHNDPALRILPAHVTLEFNRSRSELSSAIKYTRRGNMLESEGARQQ